MRLHRLTLTAFGPFGGTQEIDFDELSAAGLFLLHGPTGAGKTSVLDAVCYALYGGVPGARQGSGLALRSDHADPLTSTEVVLDLSAGGRRLEITRRPEQPRPRKRGGGFTRDKAQGRLREYDPADGGWKALSRSHQEIGEEIAQLLGMNREQFCQVVLLPQGDFARFLRAEDTARGKLLGRLFDTGRFAAVEERLAELRRAAEKQVTAGDERILGLAHRMAQAAGPSADLRAHPLPESEPGAPGLAATVLGWAAVARSAAREQLDIAEAAVRAAEAEHQALQEAAAVTRERAALQQRHAAARRRKAEFDADRAQDDAARARLERARAAEAVAPALELRDESEAEHRTATATERRCRALLPGGLQDAEPGLLADEERRLRERLGALAAARRAEERAAAVVAELADLMRDAQADEEVIAETVEWTDTWDARRAELRQRVETAQEAATRAEQVAGRIGPARQQVDAARRRDDLVARLGDARARLLETREDATALRERWLDLKDRRLAGIAAELAAGLVPGAACAVCGATEHPRPARPGAGQVDRAAEEAALEASRRADAVREDTDRRTQVLAESLAAATEAAGDASASTLDDALAALQQEYARARDAAADVHPARETLARAEHEYEVRRAERQDAERRTAARASRREGLEREHAVLLREVDRARGDAASVAEHAALLEERLTRLADAAEAARAGQAAARRFKESDARLADAAYRAGFAAPRLAAEAMLDSAAQRDLQHRIDRRGNALAAVEAELYDPRVSAAAGRPPADEPAARALADAATRRLRETSARDAAARTRCRELDRLSGQADAEARRLGPLRVEYDRVARLAALTAGTSAENERKMRLESYVLAARLEQVAAAATARLRRMSSGRYTLVHSDGRTPGRGRAGLGLHVVDAWTGRARDTATLSGGETFFASLALALGLADVVTEEAGGMRLDTLFIDEGFGSLDEQTLDEVLDVLDGLRERDRTVGIVSHVADLRQRIPAQLEIVKDRGGSAVRHRLAGHGGG